jgi:hypothetical protein
MAAIDFAYSVQLNREARSMHCALLRDRASESLAHSWRSKEAEADQPLVSPTVQYHAALPPASLRAAISLAITGVPQAIASIRGNPKPSLSEGNSSAAERL